MTHVINYIITWLITIFRKRCFFHLKLYDPRSFSRKSIIFISRYIPSLYRWRKCISRSYELPTIRAALSWKMRSMENARPEKRKEYEVHRAAYSHSIKKFLHENFSCKLAKGARVRIFHAFRACPCRQRWRRIVATSR